MISGQIMFIDFMPPRVTDDVRISDPRDVDITALRHAVREGARVFVGFIKGDAPSISFLKPVIDEVTFLDLDSDRAPISGLRLLDRATKLRYLGLPRRIGTDHVNLSELPELTYFAGPVRRQVESVLENPNLKDIVLYGALPKKSLAVAAPVQSLSLSSPGAAGVMPLLKDPSALTQILIDSARSFDVGVLRRFGNLRTIAMRECKAVTGIAALREFTRLEWLEASNVSSEEDWGVLNYVCAPHAHIAVEPKPPLSWRRAWKARGWWVNTDDDLGEEELARFGVVRVLRDLADGWAEVRVQDLSAFDDTVYSAGGPAKANGQAIEKILRALIKPEFGDLSGVEYDSESSMMSVLFSNDDAAVRLARLLDEATFATEKSD